MAYFPFLSSLFEEYIRDYTKYQQIIPESSAPNKLMDICLSNEKHVSQKTITSREYVNTGHLSIQTILNHFGVWNHALEQAGLDQTTYRESSDIDFYEEIESLWSLK